MQNKKNKIRIKAKNIRKLIRSTETDYKIIKNLFKLKEYINAKNVLIYHPLPFEVNVLPCLKDSTKTFFFPRVNGSELEVSKYSENEFKQGNYNIKEPTGEPIKDLSVIDTVIIPAVAVDINGYRLGYGKGYYDRFLQDKNYKKIVLIYEKLVYSTVFPDTHDIKFDIAVSENFILKVR